MCLRKVQFSELKHTLHKAQNLQRQYLRGSKPLGGGGESTRHPEAATVCPFMGTARGCTKQACLFKH